MADFTETNRAHWNKTAATYNTHHGSTIERLVDEIQSRKKWIGVDWLEDEPARESASGLQRTSGTSREVRLLDYACGPGTMSKALLPYISSAVGIDLSENMVEQYNTNASNQGLSQSEMRAVVGNLLTIDDESPAHLTGPEFYNFDIAVVGLGFHHFEDPILTARRLTERLKSGGVLCIMDFVPHEGHDGHEHSHGSGHSHDHSSVDKTAIDATIDKGKGTTQTFKKHSLGDDDNSELSEKEQRIQSTVKHFGFSPEQVQQYFKAAGVAGQFSYDVVRTDVVFKMETRTMTRKIFFARGTKI